MKIVAIIPARIGSQRIKRKNIKILGDQPLIAYTISRAVESHQLNQVIVSTDSEDIADCVQALNQPKVKVLMRDPALAQSTTSTEDVLLNVAAELNLDSEDAIVTLLPTSPFRSGDLIDRCVEKFKQTSADSVLTVRRMRVKFGREIDSGFFKHAEKYPAQMHKVEETLFDNPAVYVTKVKVLRESKFILGGKNAFVEIDRVEGHDINDSIDWMTAEAIIESGCFNL